MPPLHIFFSFSLFFLFFLFFLFPQRARAASADCSISSCRNGPPVRFPFRLRRIQPLLCGYPRFDLSCNNQTTTLTLPGSGAFLVKRIDYKYQTLWINDPNSCLPKRLLSHPFSLHDTPFSVVGGSKNYTFLNCSSSQTTSTLPATATSISCLSGGGYTVYAVPSSAYYASAPAAAPSSSASPELCSVISTALVGEVTRDGVAVTWSQPDCSDCEAKRKNCGFDTVTNQIMCYDRKKSHVLPRGAKYGIIIGVGIPGLLFVIAIANYIYSRIFGRRHQPSTDDLSTSTALQSANIVVGLDAPTIESYPKTLLGESRRLPRANDNTCSICLGEYQPKEALRTIPECNHYFHANCIDEWLKLNATCPVCRKSPEGSSHVTPSSSVSSSTSSSLASVVQ
ncbi:RING-H2 finger protein ATL20 [Rosa sericea]